MARTTPKAKATDRMPPTEMRSSATIATIAEAATAFCQDRKEKNQSPIEAIGDLAAHQRQTEGGQKLHQAHQPQIEGPAGQIIDLPAQRHALHRQGDGGEERGREIEGEIAIAKGGKNRRHWQWPSGTRIVQPSQPVDDFRPSRHGARRRRPPRVLSLSTARVAMKRIAFMRSFWGPLTSL